MRREHVFTPVGIWDAMNCRLATVAKSFGGREGTWDGTRQSRGNGSLSCHPPHHPPPLPRSLPAQEDEPSACLCHPSLAAPCFLGSCFFSTCMLMSGLSFCKRKKVIFQKTCAAISFPARNIQQEARNVKPLPTNNLLKKTSWIQLLYDASGNAHQ